VRISRGRDAPDPFKAARPFQEESKMKIRLLTGAVLLAWGITGAHAQSTDNSNDPTTQQFLKALEQRDTGDYLAEISALENILQSQPTLTRVHAELAVAYFQSLNFTAARAEAQKLLADPATPPAVRANLERLLTSIDRDSRTHLFTPYISLGYGHDTNVNVGPGADTIQIGGNAFSLAPGVPRQSDNYTQLNAGVSYRYLAPQQMQIMNRPASFLWQANASLYANEYSSLSKYSLEVATVSTGPSLVSAGRYRTSLNVQVDDISLGHQHIADYYGVNPNYTWIMGKAELALDASVQQRRFTGIANNGHDSNYQKVGLTYGRQLLDDRLTVQVGANTWKEDADLAGIGQ